MEDAVKSTLGQKKQLEAIATAGCEPWSSASGQEWSWLEVDSQMLFWWSRRVLAKSGSALRFRLDVKLETATCWKPETQSSLFFLLGPLTTDWRKYVQGYLPTRSGNGHLREHQTPMNLKCYPAILKLLGLPAEEYIDVCAYTIHIYIYTRMFACCRLYRVYYIYIYIYIYKLFIFACCRWYRVNLETVDIVMPYVDIYVCTYMILSYGTCDCIHIYVYTCIHAYIYTCIHV